MFAKHLTKINTLLSQVQNDTQKTSDSISLISRHMGRTTTTSINGTNGMIRSRIKRPQSMYGTKTKIVVKKEELQQSLEKVLRNMFKAKCKDARIECNQRSWELFVRTFGLKNKINSGNIDTPVLNLANANLGPACLPHLNHLIEMYSFQTLILSKNIVNPSKIQSLTTLKQLILNNCGLNNDSLQSLFDRLVDSSYIQKLSLSSPQIKDRNQLTRYDKLIVLIKNSKSLLALELSNVQIQPDSGIIQACRNASVKHLDLSDNSHVKGISPSLLSLNLARNNISAPFELPMTPCLLQSLNLSYNKIPYYYFKSFLKNIYFPNLKQLVLDRIHLNGPIGPIQSFLEQTLSLQSLSLVECDLGGESYVQIAGGIRNNRSLKFVDLSRNRVNNTRVAQSISLMLQGSILAHLKMRHCDIKDNIGALIFKNLQKTHYLQTIDMTNNLLGDQTARQICRQLKKAKSIIQLRLDHNIIKYKDRQQINSYLQSNKHVGQAQLDIQFRQINQINRQQEEAERKLREEEGKAGKLLNQNQELERVWFHLFKVSNQEKKIGLIREIMRIREEETQLQQKLFVRQTMMVQSINMNLSHKSSDFDNPQINIPSPTAKQGRFRPTG